MKRCLGGEGNAGGGEASSGESLLSTGISEMEEKLQPAAAKVEVRPLHAGSLFRDPLPKTHGRNQQIIAAATVSILPLMFGTCLGWISPVQPLLQSSLSPVGELTEDQVSWLASLIFIGGISGTFIWSKIADSCGRKKASYCVASSFMFGWGLTAFTDSPSLLLVGRFLNGLGGSGSLILAPLYIGEIAQDTIRGTLGSFVVLSVNGGVVLVYLLGAVLEYELLNYIFFSLPLVFFSLYFWMPESPVYLWRKNRQSEAEVTLLWLRGGDFRSAQEEMLEFTYKKSEDEITYAQLFNTQGKRKGMLISLGLFTWQQFCGILAILSYTSFIFEKSGSSISPDRSTIIVGVFQLFASFISSLIVERTGRKILLLISYMFMGLSLSSIGSFFYFEEQGFYVGTFSWVPIVALSTHVLTYALGAGPLPYVLMCETLPLEIRGLAASTIILWGTFFAFVSVKIFPLLIYFSQLYGCFWFFSIFCYAGFFFTWSLVPETKGIPLQNILKRLNGESFDGV